MDYRLIKEEPLATGIKRIGILLNAQAVSQINLLVEEHPHEAVHELRKRFKELRGLIRLVRYPLGECYARENEFYRDLGRDISHIRDLRAFIEALTHLKVQYSERLSKDAFSATEAFLNHRLRELAESIKLKDTLRHIQARLKEHEDVIRQWPVDAGTFHDIYKSLMKVYARGYRMMRSVKDNSSVESFHELRKRGKYMRYHMEILNFAWPAMMAVQAGEFGNFADLLGDDHDLALCLAYLEQEKPDEEEFQLIKAIVNHQRALLQQQVLSLGHKLYAERPRTFTRRIYKYWLAQEISYTGKG